MHALRDTFGFDQPDPGLDYGLCEVEGSRLLFRGPMPEFHHRYIAILGGSETFGKYVATPYSALLADWLGVDTANLGVVHAGLSLFSEEHVLLDIASKAEVTVLQVLGAQNMSNRLYQVHPRRNDRFLGASKALRVIFPKVDFSQINFTGHLLGTLRDASPTGFEVVVSELKIAWMQRMRRVLEAIRGDVLLLRITAPEDEWQFVDDVMIGELRGQVAGVVELAVSGGTLDGMIFPEGERNAAAKLPGPADHHRMAEALLPALSDILGHPGQTRGPARSTRYSFSTSSGTAVNRSATRP